MFPNKEEDNHFFDWTHVQQGGMRIWVLGHTSKNWEIWSQDHQMLISEVCLYVEGLLTACYSSEIPQEDMAQVVRWAYSRFTLLTSWTESFRNIKKASPQYTEEQLIESIFTIMHNSIKNVYIQSIMRDQQLLGNIVHYHNGLHKEYASAIVPAKTLKVIDLPKGVFMPWTSYVIRLNISWNPNELGELQRLYELTLQYILIWWAILSLKADNLLTQNMLEFPQKNSKIGSLWRKLKALRLQIQTIWVSLWVMSMPDQFWGTDDLLAFMANSEISPARFVSTITNISSDSSAQFIATAKRDISQALKEMPPAILSFAIEEILNIAGQQATTSISSIRVYLWWYWDTIV